MQLDDLKRECHGKWESILTHFGVDIGAGKHCPCPACGGKDRFRFDGFDNNGTYICNQCGAGDGFSLLMKVNGWDFPETLKQVSEVVGMVEKTDIKPQKEVDPAIALRKLYSSCQELSQTDPVMRYLKSRKLVLTPNDVKYCPECYESETKTKMTAMVAIIRNKNGIPISMHRTYLNGGKKADIKSPRKIMPGKEKLNGSAIRLFDGTHGYFKENEKCIGVAEGIETAMAAAQLFSVPTWACLSTTILESFEPPEGIREIYIFGDCDGNFAGQKSAYTLANKLYLKDYLVKVMIPNVGDWADQL